MCNCLFIFSLSLSNLNLWTISPQSMQISLSSTSAHPPTTSSIPEHLSVITIQTYTIQMFNLLPSMNSKTKHEWMSYVTSQVNAFWFDITKIPQQQNLKCVSYLPFVSKFSNIIQKNFNLVREIYSRTKPECQLSKNFYQILKNAEYFS